jgi:transposase
LIRLDFAQPHSTPTTARSMVRKRSIYGSRRTFAQGSRQTNIVAAVAITDSNGGDSPQFGPLVKKTSEGFTINEVSADMAYSSRLNLQLVANEGGKAYIPYRKNATGKSRGSSLWSKMYHYFQINRDDFMEHYHKRSNIEATNAAIKRKFGETLKSKNPTAQVNELLAKIIAYNLTVVIHEIYENGINPDFALFTKL